MCGLIKKTAGMYKLLLAIIVSHTLSFAVTELWQNCPMGAKYPNPEDCREYFTCSNGAVSKMSCTSSQHFIYSASVCKSEGPCAMAPVKTWYKGPCHFPFKAYDRTFYSCTKYNEATGLLWCSLTANYGSDKLMDYCNLTKKVIYHTGDFVTRYGTLVNRDDWGEFKTDSSAKIALPSAIYIHKVEALNYQYDVELKVDDPTNTDSGVIYNVEEEQVYNFITLNMNMEKCIACGSAKHNILNVDDSVKILPGCSVETGKWIALSVRVYQPNVVQVYINGKLVTDEIRLKNPIFGWVGLHVSRHDTHRILLFRKPKLSALTATTTTSETTNTTSKPPNEDESDRESDKKFGKLSELFGDKALYVIIGAAVGGFLLLCVIIGATCNSLRRKKSKKSNKRKTKKKKGSRH